MTLVRSNARLARNTVLFVASDADARFVYQSLAASEGWRAEFASDSRDAVALAHLFVPDVIVIDLSPHDLEGIGLARRLRESVGTCPIPIVLVSCGDTARVDAMLREGDCEGHLVRPCPPRDLRRLIQVLALRKVRTDRGPATSSVRPNHAHVDARGQPVGR